MAGDASECMLRWRDAEIIAPSADVSGSPSSDHLRHVCIWQGWASSAAQSMTVTVHQLSGAQGPSGQLNTRSKQAQHSRPSTPLPAAHAHKFAPA